MGSNDLTTRNRIPLQLFLLAHSQSDSAQLLAEELMKRFVDPPATGGLRLPVFFTRQNSEGLPPTWNVDGGVNLDDAEHSVVVVLADARMARFTDDGTGDRWSQFLQDGINLAASSSGKHCVFGVAVGGNGYLVSDKRHMVGVAEIPDLPDKSDTTDQARVQRARFDEWLAETADFAALQITIRAIPLIEPRAVSVGPGKRPPITLFLSHSKADLGVADANADEADPVRNVELAVKELPIQYWFDAQDIPPAEEFESAIEQGVRDCSIVVVFLTDQYSSRPYCQWEVLISKRLHTPMLVVDALSIGERRSFPYLGNLPTIHWSGNDRKAEATKIVFRALRETLRFLHNRACLTSMRSSSSTAGASEVILANAPEAITLAHYPPPDSGTQTFVYPDPPLNRSELNTLRSLRNADFVTPLVRLTRAPRPAFVITVAVSISDSAELPKYGLCQFHEQTLTDEIHLSLLMSGLQIAYGGRLDPPAAGRTNNFTLRLFDLVRGYSSLAANAETKLEPILNIPPWPLWLTYNDSIMRLFGKVAKLTKGKRPPTDEIPETDEDGNELFPAKSNPFTLPDTPLRRLAWTRGLTLMRKQMTSETQARIVIGGKLFGFSGIYPGVIEEAWFSLSTGRPLYLVGFLGGAAKAVIDLLEGHERKDVSQPNLGVKAPSIEAILQMATLRGLKIIDSPAPMPNSSEIPGTIMHPAQIADDICIAGEQGLAAALKNGLTDEQNRELFRATDPTRISALIVEGLSHLPNDMSL